MTTLVFCRRFLIRLRLMMIVKLVQCHQNSSQGKKLISRGEYHYFIILLNWLEVKPHLTNQHCNPNMYLYLFPEHQIPYEVQRELQCNWQQCTIGLRGHPILMDLVKSSPFQSSLTQQAEIYNSSAACLPDAAWTKVSMTRLWTIWHFNILYK